MAKIVANFANGKRGAELFRGVLGAAIGNSVNTILLMKLIKMGTKGMLIAAFTAGAAQALVDFLEDLLITKTVSLKKLTYNFFFNSAATFAGNYLGSKLIYINGSWFQPKHIVSFFTKSYGKKLLTQAGIGSLLNTIIDITVNYLGKIL